LRFKVNVVLRRLPDFVSKETNLRKAAESKWWAIVTKLQQSLRTAVFYLPKSEQQPFIISITETEVTHGILANPASQTQSFCIIRNIDGIDSLALEFGEMRKYVDILNTFPSTPPCVLITLNYHEILA
jgi:hypothetical protein